MEEFKSESTSPSEIGMDETWNSGSEVETQEKGKAKFIRYYKVQKTGWTKGRVDVYMTAPNAEVLSLSSLQINDWKYIIKIIWQC